MANGGKERQGEGSRGKSREILCWNYAKIVSKSMIKANDSLRLSYKKGGILYKT